MRIYTKGGDLAFKTFSFPDGQPHFKLETYEREFQEVTIETAIKSTSDLFMVALASSVLRSNGYSSINLDIRYLMAARMDRAIDWAQPFTLSLVAQFLNSCGFTRVRVLDAHSEVATRLIRNCWNVLPMKIVDQVYTTVGTDCVVVTPDRGAISRVSDLMVNWEYRYARCAKVRDMATGALSGFYIQDGKDNVKGKDCLILDDICDGGGTFVGLAKVLREAGAKKVNLFITHGIFSKGLEALEGIDKIFTTDSYCQYGTGREFQRTVVIPISMKEL